MAGRRRSGGGLARTAEELARDHAQERAARAGELWERLLQVAQFLNITRYGADDWCMHVTIGGRRRCVVRGDVSELVAAALDEEWQKMCSGCHQRKAPREFGFRTNTPDGRASQCKVCERKRQAAKATADPAA